MNYKYIMSHCAKRRKLTQSNGTTFSLNVQNTFIHKENNYLKHEIIKRDNYIDSLEKKYKSLENAFQALQDKYKTTLMQKEFSNSALHEENNNCLNERQFLLDKIDELSVNTRSNYLN